MQRIAESGRQGPGASMIDDAMRADSLLQAAIAILDAGGFDCAAAYAVMARQALAEAMALPAARG